MNVLTGRFDDVGAVVTGAGHGIGRATALRLSAEGARVAVIDLELDSAGRTAAEIVDRGGEAHALAADVSVSAEVEEAMAEASSRLGGFSVLHSNAGVQIAGSIVDQTDADWAKTFAVNVDGFFYAARVAVPTIVASGGGAIVCTASTSGLVGEAGNFAYGASKGALVKMTRDMAVDLAPRGIRVNCVCPGWIDTGFNDSVVGHLSEAEMAAMVGSEVPLGRQGDAEEVAAAVAFLASSDAAYVTGHALVVDGGLTIV